MALECTGLRPTLFEGVANKLGFLEGARFWIFFCAFQAARSTVAALLQCWNS